MRRILVTGANKGIGLAIAEAILREHADTFVLLGSRDVARGREAAASLPAGRVEVLAIDVADDASVRAAAASASGDLYAIVNNAGIASGSLAEVLEVNTFGVRRVCDAFGARVTDRIVNVTSAAGPTFVAACSPERQRFFLDASMTWPRLRAFLEECLAIGDDRTAFAAKGLGDGAPYGLSKACTNALTFALASEYPALRVNACTPGFIDTDLTRHFAQSSGKSAEELGMKPPSAGARAPMHLLFGDLEGNARYYGSDAQRSPLDRYRAPGSPPYTGP